MQIDEQLGELRRFALELEAPALVPQDVIVEADERLDGDRVTRVTLLLPDPGGDTWPLEAIRRLRADLNRRASDLGLPRVTTILVAESEPEATDLFSRTH